MEKQFIHYASSEVDVFSWYREHLILFNFVTIFVDLYHFYLLMGAFECIWITSISLHCKRTVFNNSHNHTSESMKHQTSVELSSSARIIFGTTNMLIKYMSLHLCVVQTKKHIFSMLLPRQIQADWVCHDE